MNAWKAFLVSFFGCGTAFWISDVIIPVFDRKEQGYAVTFACPIVLILSYAAVLKLRKQQRSGPSTAIFAICGMWVLALTFIMLAQTVRGNGFKGGSWSLGDSGYLFISSFLPLRIIEFVALEGTIIALLIGTVMMIAAHLLFERSRWIVPPNVSNFLKRGRTIFRTHSIS